MKRIGLITLALVLALGMLGIGYAAWSQTLNITATVDTGNFNVSMTNTTVEKPADSSGTTFTVTENTTDKATYNAGNAGLNASITNAVPGTYKIKGVVIHNHSSIPVHVTVSAVTTNGSLKDATGWVNVGTLASTDLAATTDTAGTDITIIIPAVADQTANYGFIIPVTAAQK